MELHAGWNVRQAHPLVHFWDDGLLQGRAHLAGALHIDDFPVLRNPNIRTTNYYTTMFVWSGFHPNNPPITLAIDIDTPFGSVLNNSQMFQRYRPGLVCCDRFRLASTKPQGKNDDSPQYRALHRFPLLCPTIGSRGSQSVTLASRLSGYISQPGRPLVMSLARPR